MDGQGAERSGRAGQGRYGAARIGKARQGTAGRGRRGRRGITWSGVAGLGSAWQARSGEAGRGPVRMGVAGGARPGKSWLGTARQAWTCKARTGGAWRGRLGSAWQRTVGKGLARLGRHGVRGRAAVWSRCPPPYTERTSIHREAANRMSMQPGQPDIELTVPGIPVPWAQAAHNPKAGGRFIPHRQATQAARIIQAWEASGGEKVPKPRGVEIGCLFTVVRPASHYWRAGVSGGPLVLRPDSPSHPTGRPDLSNLLKLVEDALTTQAWDDDDQVVVVHPLRKEFAEEAMTIIWIRAVAPVVGAAISQEALELTA